MGKPTLGISVMLALIILAGCYVYGPVPPPAPVYSYGPSAYERSWNAALAAMEDAGDRIVSAERSSGIMRGTRDSVEATVTVRTQADGRVRVEFNTRGPSGQDPYLA